MNLKARIVETTRDFVRELGVQWGFQGVADAAHGNTTGLVFPNNLTVRGQNQPGSGIESLGIGGTPFAVNLPASEVTSGIALTMAVCWIRFASMCRCWPWRPRVEAR